MQKIMHQEKSEDITIEVEIRGLKPLLMSSQKEMFRTDENEGTYAARKFGKKIDPKAEAERRSYRLEDHGWKGDLCIHDRHIHRCLELTAKNPRFKAKRGDPSPSQAIKGSVEILPKFIPLLDGEGKKRLNDFDVNTDTVIIQKSRIVRHRPEIKDWSVVFRTRWDPSLYNLTPHRLKEIIERAGRTGLLDYRPTYGTFKLVRFDPVEE